MRFDVNNDITLEHRQCMIVDVDVMIQNNTHLQNNEFTPKYQSLPVLFNEQFPYVSSLHWQILRDTFLNCCWQYLKTVENFTQNQDQLQPTGVRAWFYKGSKEIDRDQGNPMHNHVPAILTGVFYVQVPGDGFEGGTELIDPRGPAERSTRMAQMPPVPGTWIVFPGWMDHRSCQVDSDSPRYVIAADCYVKVR